MEHIQLNEFAAPWYCKLTTSCSDGLYTMASNFISAATTLAGGSSFDPAIIGDIGERRKLTAKVGFRNDTGLELVASICFWNYYVSIPSWGITPEGTNVALRLLG